MNYRGSMPAGHGSSGYDDPQNLYAQQQQQQHQQQGRSFQQHVHPQQHFQHQLPQQYHSQTFQADYNAYPQPHFQQSPQHYTQAQFNPYGYQPQAQHQAQHQVQNVLPHQQHGHLQPQHVQLQQLQASGLDYSSGFGQQGGQFQTFNSPYAQSPIQPTQHAQSQYGRAESTIRSPQPPLHQQAQAPPARPQQTQQTQQYIQPMDWQQMPPPLKSSVSAPAQQSQSPQLQQDTQMPPIKPQYQQQQESAQPTSQPAQQRRPSQAQSYSPQVQQHPQIAQQRMPQRQHSMPQMTGSPPIGQSPKLPQQNNVKRLSSAGARVDQTARVSASPRLPAHAGPTRSSSVSSTRSPAPAPGLIPYHADTNALLISVAEELFTKARESAAALADSMDAASLKEYQKMMATGLGCLEVVLGSHKLAPRVEARLQLRYASILSEETNNVMEAETALTKGITLCERNRFADLKCSMQFLQIKMLAQRRGKAAMITVDARIKESEVMKYSHWTYAFRFLKASLYLQSANPAEAAAIENLKAIATMAGQRGDRAVSVVAMLLEGLSLLKTMKEDAIMRIQGCLAQAAKFQLEDSVYLMQTDILMLMLDLACSLHQKSPQIIAQKYGALQERLDGYLNNSEWGLSDTEMLVPIRKNSGSQYVISEDTAAILRPGSASEECDYLAMSFWSKLEAFTITYTYSGLGNLYKSSRNDKKISELWGEATNQLENNAYKIRGVPTSLPDAVSKAHWRRDLKAYLNVLRGLHLATRSKWKEVRKCIDELKVLLKSHSGGLLCQYLLYLSGSYAQGTGDLKQAMSLFSDSSFDIGAYTMTAAGTSSKQAELEVSMLATFNRIWIMQHPSYRDDYAAQELLEQLRPLCTDNQNLEIRTTYNLLLAAIRTTPPIPMTAVKSHISAALNGSKMLGDVQTLSIALCLMQAKLFQGIVGEQALKSARAASQQAKKCGNMLWMSVADGMLAVSLETQGQIAEASSVHAEACKQAVAVQAVMSGRDTV